ncbi:MAG TPA: AMP-binding protein [Candidatus Eisenbacteria bacterium]|nr:AMP-binding protein [Candidatus Eisenbacteria bacterium]
MHPRSQFVEELRARLLAHAGKVLLRIAVSPDFERPHEFTGEALLDRAEHLASSFAFARERSVVLLLLPHSQELFLLQLGLVLCGHIPAVLAWPTNRVDAEKYQRNLVHQLSHLPADQLITLPRLAGNLRGSLPYPVAGLAIENAAGFEKIFPAAPVMRNLERGEFPVHNATPDPDTVFLQFSGGTTGAQKAIVVTSGMLCAQFRDLAEALAFSPSDTVVSWLPMYHDMGLIACYWLPLWHGASSLQMAANDWILNPGLLPKYIQRFRGSICWLPNFAFSYLSQRREQLPAHNLASMRAWINCSEPVRLKSLQQFASSFADCGVRQETLQASYAMAETVFAITQTKLGEPPATIPRAQVRRANHAHSDLAFDLLDPVYVSSGRPLCGTEVRIVAPDGSLCPEAAPGEIHVRAPSLFSGYWGARGFQTHSLNDGWHATGDFGFLSGCELFVIGRFKDIIIVGGNNIFPEDVEAAVNTLDGIYPGRVVAFGVEDPEIGTQSLAVVAEMQGEFLEDAAQALEAAIRKLVLTTIGTAARHVAAVPRRWIVKSTAGKISRGETRERFLREFLNQA